MMGTRFGLVAISERWIPRLVENVRRYGLERQLAGIEPMRTSPVDLKRGLTDDIHRADLLDQFRSAAQRLLARGADVIIPAGGEVVVFTVEAGMYQIEGAPIVNGVIELVKMGEAAAKLARLTGRFATRRSAYAPPSGELLARVRARYGPEVYPNAEG
jgi:Asp/Glu/hydantoin racemase